MSFARHRNSISTTLKRIRHTLFVPITLIITCTTLLVISFIMFGVWYQYYTSEKQFAHNKLSYYYWVGQQALTYDVFALRKLHNAYEDDTRITKIPYGIRIINTSNDKTLMYVHPHTWVDVNNQLVFPSIEQTIENGWEGITLSMKYNNTKVLSDIVAYSLALNEQYILQLLVVVHEKRNAFKTIQTVVFENLITLLLIILVISYIIFKIILRPVYDINSFAQQIIQKQIITARLPKKRKSIFTGLEQNINEMLNTIGRLVNSLKQSNVNLSHDIRTPLTHIRNHLEMIHSESKDKKIHSRIEICFQTIDTVQKFTTQVLNRAEIELGLAQIPEKPENVLVILKDVIEMYEYIADSKDIIFKCDIDPEVYVYVHKLRFCQLVGNILDNACKFTGAGKQISLSAKNINKAIQIQISDEGEGIEKENIPHIWDMFWQKGITDRITKDNQKTSSGFGLSIVKSIVIAYGGTIHVDSQKNRGTVFTIKFPSQRK